MGRKKKGNAVEGLSALQLKVGKFTIVLQDSNLGKVTLEQLGKDLTQRYRKVVQDGEHHEATGFFLKGGDLMKPDSQTLSSLGLKGDDTEVNVLNVIMEDTREEEVVEFKDEVIDKNRSCNCFGLFKCPDFTILPGIYFFWAYKVCPSLKMPSEEWASKEWCCPGTFDKWPLSWLKRSSNWVVRKFLSLMVNLTMVYVPHITVFTLWDLLSTTIYIFFLYCFVAFFFYLAWIFYDQTNIHALYVYAGVWGAVVAAGCVALGNTFITDLLVDQEVNRAEKISDITKHLEHLKDQLVNYDSEGDNEDGLLIKRQSQAVVG